MFQKLKAKFEQDPLATIFVCSLAVTATAKLIDAVSGASSKHAYAKLVKKNARGF